MKPARRRVDHEPAFVLHSYAYKETSLVLETFTRSYGRVALLARGARRPRSALRGVLMAFQPLRLSWTGTGELCNLTGAEWAGGQAVLGGFSLMCGFYVNELMIRLLPRDDAHEALYDAYATSLARLSIPAAQSATALQSAILRGFERRLLAELGYALTLDRDAADGLPIDPARRYVYQPERGPVGSERSEGELQVGGQTLLDIARDDYSRAETRDEARLLLRALLGVRLGNRDLYTRSVMMELQEL